jgi:hypothetical protein
MVGSPTQKPKGGLRGRDKQQGALRDQDSVRDRGRMERSAVCEQGREAQAEAAQNEPQSPGQPAGGE